MNTGLSLLMRANVSATRGLIVPNGDSGRVFSGEREGDVVGLPVPRAVAPQAPAENQGQREAGDPESRPGAAYRARVVRGRSMASLAARAPGICQVKAGIKILTIPGCFL